MNRKIVPLPTRRLEGSESDLAVPPARSRRPLTAPTRPRVMLRVPMDTIEEALRQATILRDAALRALDYTTRGVEMGGDAGEACLRKARETLEICNKVLNVHRDER